MGPAAKKAKLTGKKVIGSSWEALQLKLSEATSSTPTKVAKNRSMQGPSERWRKNRENQHPKTEERHARPHTALRSIRANPEYLPKLAGLELQFVKSATMSKKGRPELTYSSVALPEEDLNEQAKIKKLHGLREDGEAEIPKKEHMRTSDFVQMEDDRWHSYQECTTKTLAGALSVPDTDLLNLKLILSPSLLTRRQQEIGNYVAIDCEFAGAGPRGAKSVLGRVSIVNYYGHVLMDEFVRPTEIITDWRTRYSGLTHSLCSKGITPMEAEERARQIVRGHKLVGHGLSNDLAVLKLHVHSRDIVDTQNLPRYKEGTKIAPSLRNVLWRYFGFSIQTGSHDSVEDARASMLIFRHFKNDFKL